MTELKITPLIAAGVVLLGTAGCTKTIDWLFDAPPPEMADSASQDNRASAMNTSPSALVQSTTQPEVLPVATKSEPEIEIQNVLAGWRAAWASKNTADYFSHYSPSFKGKESSHEKWQASRKRVFNHAQAIKITLSGPEIKFNGEGVATVEFKQEYQARNLTDTGKKTLKLRKTDGHWLIEEETFIHSAN